MRMVSAQRRLTSRSVERFDPLRQHPLNPVIPIVLSDPRGTTTRTIFLNRSYERLSPTLASSPRFVDASRTRRASVHLRMCEFDTMQKGFIQAANFFDDGSSASEHGDSVCRPTHIYTADSRPGHRDRPYDIDRDNTSAPPRGRSRHRSTIDDLAKVGSRTIQRSDYSGVNEEHIVDDEKTTSQARQMSLTRLNRDKVRLVDNRSVRSSIDSSRRSYGNSLPTSPAYPISPFTKPNPSPREGNRLGEDELTPLPRSPNFRGSYHLRSISDPNNTSTSSSTSSSSSASDSVLADSIINAHAHTMRALEALSAEPSINGSDNKDKLVTGGRSYLNSGTIPSWPTSTSSLSANRRVTLSPLATTSLTGKEGDAINTPNLFATPSSPEYPAASYDGRSARHPNFLLSASGRSVEEYVRLDSACTSAFVEEYMGCYPSAHGGNASPYDDRKGKHVLGLVTDGETESLGSRSRLERNMSAQGLVRSIAGQGMCGSGGGGGEKRKGNEEKREGRDGMIIWVGVRRWTWGVGKEMERGRERGEGACVRGRLDPIFIPNKLPFDYDTGNEKQVARFLYRENSDADTDFDDAAFALLLRGTERELTGRWYTRILSARTLRGIRFGRRGGICCLSLHSSPSSNNNSEIDNSTRRGTTEKLTTSTTCIPPRHPSETHLLGLHRNPAKGKKKYLVVTWARRIASPPLSSYSNSVSGYVKDSHVPTLELVYTISPTRILVVMAVLLSLSVVAAMTWVFLGSGMADKSVGEGGGEDVGDGKGGRSQRVGSGMAIGVLVLLVEGCGFGAWVVFS